MVFRLNELSAIVYVAFFSLLRFDYLKITNEDNKEFGLICGVQHGSDVIVIGNYARLIFHSDAEVQKKGFLMSFTTVPKSGEYKQNDTCREQKVDFFVDLRMNFLHR